jgi:hypothetical protein
MSSTGDFSKVFEKKRYLEKPKQLDAPASGYLCQVIQSCSLILADGV